MAVRPPISYNFHKPVKPAVPPVIESAIAKAAPIAPAPVTPPMPAPPSPERQWASVPLGPNLPMSIYTSLEPWNEQRIGAVALYCSDGRWGEAFDDFCHRRLNLPRYDRLATPGGPGALVRADPATRNALKSQLDFLIENHGLTRLVLITHYNCGLYKKLLATDDPDKLLPAQLQDLTTATQSIQNWHPSITVDRFLAMRRHSTLSFHALP